MTTFVTHSSLSQEQRQQAEHAFAARDNCVIVATSVLELGIDVGNLDRVIQIDAPPTVSSFLQRMGRTGRRGSPRNCLFLATSDDSLVRAAGLIDLWAEGYIEAIVPPPLPYHILAQQLMALTLQEQGIGRSELWKWLGGVPAFREMQHERREEVLQWMIDQEILWSDQGILSFGQKGEKAYGRKNFLELFSVFLSPPLFSVLHGRQELGFVDELTFLGKHDGPRILLLGGRAGSSTISIGSVVSRMWKQRTRRDNLAGKDGAAALITHYARRSRTFSSREVAVDAGHGGQPSRWRTSGTSSVGSTPVRRWS